MISRVFRESARTRFGFGTIRRWHLNQNGCAFSTSVKLTVGPDC